MAGNIPDRQPGVGPDDVYTTPLQTRNEGAVRINEACDAFREAQQITVVVNSLLKRNRMCIDAGQQFL